MSKTLTAADFIAALEATGGLIAPAARRLGVSRQTVYRATQTYPTVKQALDDAREALLDVAEDNIFRAASAGDVPTSKWLLERLGRDRGYVLRVENETLGFSASEVSKMSDDELEHRRRELGIK
jgi:hypothetical protein